MAESVHALGHGDYVAEGEEADHVEEAEEDGHDLDPPVEVATATAIFDRHVVTMKFRRQEISQLTTARDFAMDRKCCRVGGMRKCRFRHPQLPFYTKGQ